MVFGVFFVDNLWISRVFWTKMSRPLNYISLIENKKKKRKKKNSATRIKNFTLLFMEAAKFLIKKKFFPKIKLKNKN